jgi:dephospho-CoA kinase
MILGITGGTGSGKSTLLHLIEQRGGLVLDCDEIYHNLLQTDASLLCSIENAFPGTVANGMLDRKKLGAIVFSDETALQKLNHITHSHVLRDFRRQLKKIREEGIPAAVFDAPQLFESGANRECNIVVSVLADEETRIHRIINRDGISRQAALERIRAQKSDHFFRTHSDYIIENNLNTDGLIPQVKVILRETGVLSP